MDSQEEHLNLLPEVLLDDQDKQAITWAITEIKRLREENAEMLEEIGNCGEDHGALLELD